MSELKKKQSSLTYDELYEIAAKLYESDVKKLIIEMYGIVKTN